MGRGTELDVGHRLAHFVYRAYDEQGVLLYVGCTWQPHVRFSAHKSLAGFRGPNEEPHWFELTSRVEWEAYPSFDDAHAAERLAIRTEGPVYNRERYLMDGPAVSASTNRKREVMRQCAPIWDRIARRLEAEDKAARVNRRKPKDAA